MSAHLLLLSACCALSPVPAAPLPDPPTLSIKFEPYMIRFTVEGPDVAFLGGVIGSFSPDLVYYLNGLPPLLADFVVLGVGVGDGPSGYTTVLPENLFPPGTFVYVQGVTLVEGVLESTRVRDFVLDVTVPGR